jgi:hypothetical protein
LNSLDAPGEPVAALERAMREHALTEAQVHILAIGEQRVLIAR